MISQHDLSLNPRTWMAPPRVSKFRVQRSPMETPPPFWKKASKSSLATARGRVPPVFSQKLLWMTWIWYQDNPLSKCFFPNGIGDQQNWCQWTHFILWECSWTGAQHSSPSPSPSCGDSRIHFRGFWFCFTGNSAAWLGASCASSLLHFPPSPPLPPLCGGSWIHFRGFWFCFTGSWAAWRRASCASSLGGATRAAPTRWRACRAARTCAQISLRCWFHSPHILPQRRSILNCDWLPAAINKSTDDANQQCKQFTGEIRFWSLLGVKGLTLNVSYQSVIPSFFLSSLLIPFRPSFHPSPSLYLPSLFPPSLSSFFPFCPDLILYVTFAILPFSRSVSFVLLLSLSFFRSILCGHRVTASCCHLDFQSGFTAQNDMAVFIARIHTC